MVEKGIQIPSRTSAECMLAIEYDRYDCLVYLHEKGFLLPNRRIGDGRCLEYLVANYVGDLGPLEEPDDEYYSDEEEIIDPYGMIPFV